MKVTHTDCGEPGESDAFGITLWDRNTLVYSSNWDGYETVEQLLSGGNLLIHAGYNTKAAEITPNFKPLIQYSDLKVYPNPFNDRLRFEFVSPENTHTKIDLYDLTGRHVQTVFDQFIEGGTMYNVEFRPRAEVSAMYIYRMTLGNEVINGKAMYKDE